MKLAIAAFLLASLFQPSTALFAQAPADESETQGPQAYGEEKDDTDTKKPRTPPPPLPLEKPKAKPTKIVPKAEQDLRAGAKKTEGEAELPEPKTEDEMDKADPEAARSRHHTDVPVLPHEHIKTEVPHRMTVYRFDHRKNRWEEVKRLQPNRIYFVSTRGTRMLTRTVRNNDSLWLEMRPLATGTTVMGYMWWLEDERKDQLVQLKGLHEHARHLHWQFFKAPHNERGEDWVNLVYEELDPKIAASSESRNSTPRSRPLSSDDDEDRNNGYEP